MNSLSPISILFSNLSRWLSRLFWRWLPFGPHQAPSQKGSKRVMMVTQYLLCGLERMIFNLSTSLKSDLHWNPSVFVFDHAKQTHSAAHLGELFDAQQIPVTYFSKAEGFSVKAVFAMVSVILRDEIYVIHTHDLGALIYGALAKVVCLGSVRVVHTQHSFVHLGRKKRYQVYERIFASIADQIAVVSTDTLETYRKLGVSEKKIHLVSNGVPFAQKSDGQALTLIERQSIRKVALDVITDRGAQSILQSGMDAHWILYMARVHGRKGQDQAIKLWHEVESKFRRNALLLFVGLETDPGQLEKLLNDVAQAPDSDRIVYLGPSHQPQLWLQAAEVFLSSSEFEGMPLASIEAAGSGLPLVLSAIPGHDVLKPYSFQYPLDLPQQGARELEKVFSSIEEQGDKYFQSTWKASENVRLQYSVLQMAKNYSDLYQL